MIEKILEFVFCILEVYTKSHDPFIEEYRNYQRYMIASFIGVLVTLLFCWIFLPNEIPKNGIMTIFVTVVDQVKMILDILAMIFSIVFIVNFFQFWRFCIKHDITVN